MNRNVYYYSIDSFLRQISVNSMFLKKNGKFDHSFFLQGSMANCLAHAPGRYRCPHLLLARDCSRLSEHLLAWPQSVRTASIQESARCHLIGIMGLKGLLSPDFAGAALQSCAGLTGYVCRTALQGWEGQHRSYLFGLLIIVVDVGLGEFLEELFVSRGSLLFPRAVYRVEVAS